MTGLRRRPVQQRSRATVEYLLEAAARVFDREGIEATTNRIAEEAGVSIGSLYQYFGDKQGLLHELALRHLREVEETFDQVAAAPAAPAAELIERLLQAAVALHRPRGGLHRMMREHTPRTPELVERFTAVIDRVTCLVEKALEDCGVEEAATRARLIVAALDAQAHTVFAEDVDDGTRGRRTAMAADQIRALMGRTSGRTEKPELPAESAGRGGMRL